MDFEFPEYLDAQGLLLQVKPTMKLEIQFSSENKNETTKYTLVSIFYKTKTYMNYSKKLI